MHNSTDPEIFLQEVLDGGEPPLSWHETRMVEGPGMAAW